MKFSIVIPTLNRWDLLKRCLDSIVATTDLTDGEVIVVSNGCTDYTPRNINRYYTEKYPNIRVLHWPKALGYPKAVNLGMSAATGDIVILLNNDTAFYNNTWYSVLTDCFNTNPKIGVTGIIKRYQGGKPWVLFFCAAIKREVINNIGLLDETFTPGCGEDIDFCIRAYNKGYIIQQVPEEQLSHVEGTNKMSGAFPIYHEGGVTVNSMPTQQITYARNMKIVEERYGLPTTS